MVCHKRNTTADSWATRNSVCGGAEMQKRTRSSEVRKAGTKANRRYLIAGLVIAIAAGICTAIYEHSTAVQTTVPTMSQTNFTSIADRRTTSTPSMKQVVFGPTIPNTTTPPLKDPPGMVWIPGGEFSMGAQNPPDQDDVGMKATLDSRPIHRVYVDGFFMDKTDVTNAAFEKFVKVTGYVTVAERKPLAEDYPGSRRKIWLLVQWSLLRLIIQCRSIITSSGGPTCLVRTGAIRWGRTAASAAKATIPSFILRTRTRKLMQNGQASGFLQKPSGNSRRAEGSRASRTSGAMNFVRRANGWPTLLRAIFRTRTQVTMGIPELRQSRNSPRTDMDFMTWQGMSGSGPVTGTGQTIIRNSRMPVAWRETRKGRMPPLTHLSRAMPRKCIEAVPFYVPISIARATWWARAARAISIPGRTILGSVV